MVRVSTLCPKPISCCIALWAGLTAAAWAQSPDTLDQTSEQIEALRTEITVIQARLASQESERDALQDALREAEVQIGELDRQLGALGQGPSAVCVWWEWSVRARCRKLRDNGKRCIRRKLARCASSSG